MKTKKEIEAMRDDAMNKALEYQEKSNKAYFSDNKQDMDYYSGIFQKYMAQYHILLEVLK